MQTMDLSLNPTMTMHDLCEYFKANLLPASPDTMGDYIVAGKFPFADGLPAEDGHDRRYLISRAGAYCWLDDFLKTETIKI